MIRFLDILSFLLEWIYVFVFFLILHTFLPVRKNWLLRIIAFFACSFFAVVIIYSNDLTNLLGSFLLFSLYLAVFHQGRAVEKLTSILIFYPAVIAVNYMTLNIGSRLFFEISGAPNDTAVWDFSALLLSTAIHTVSLLIRLLFWIGAWYFLRKYLHQITSSLTTRMWLIVDTLMLASVVSIFTIIYFLPEQIIIVYPVCIASIFSSFGCMYLAAYMSRSMQTAYRAQELEMQKNYYKDRIQDENRVRSIYHDMKNHLLVLQAASSRQDIHSSVAYLQKQLRSFENYYQTGNKYLDIILRDKARVAQEKEIDFTPVIHFTDGAFIDPLDISTIFGNALDNAIEACEKLAVSQRLITVKAKRIHDMLMILVENNALPGGDGGTTTKSDAFLHGFGLSNIRKAAEKYDGQCTVKFENGMFTLKIILPIP